MSRNVCVTNFKGGVGKTTTTVNLAVAFALAGKKVLVVDCDAQASATACFLFDRMRINRSLGDLLLDRVTVKQATFASGIKNLHVIAAKSDVHYAELKMAEQKNRAYLLLREKLAPARSEYDLILFDTHPCLGPLTLNAICASDYLLVPMQCSFLAYDALLHLMNMVTQIKLQFHAPLLLLGLLMTMVEEGQLFPLTIKRDVARHFQRLVFKNSIPRDSQLQGASGQGLIPVLQRPRSLVARAYRELVGEVEERFNLIPQLETVVAGRS